MTIDSGLREYGWDSAKSTPDHAYTLPAIIRLLPARAGVSHNTQWLRGIGGLNSAKSGVIFVVLDYKL